MMTVHFTTRHGYHMALLTLGNCWMYGHWIAYDAVLLFWEWKAG